MNRFTLFLLLQIALFNLSGQDYQFKEPKDLKKEIELVDSYFNNSVRLKDTSSITFYDRDGNKLKTLYKYVPMVHFDSISKMAISINNEFGKTYNASKYVYNNSKLTDQIDYGVLFDTFFDTSFIGCIFKYNYYPNNIKRIDTYEDGTKLIYTEISQYDNQKRLIRYTYVYYKNENTILYLIPNSLDIDWKRMSNSMISGYTTDYSYTPNYRIGSSKDSTGFYGLDTIFYTNGLISKDWLYSKNRHQYYKYNTKKQLIELVISSCKDCDELFGSANKYTYEYDLDGYLIVKKEYYNDLLMQKFYYKRIKK